MIANSTCCLRMGENARVYVAPCIRAWPHMIKCTLKGYQQSLNLATSNIHQERNWSRRRFMTDLSYLIISGETEIISKFKNEKHLCWKSRYSSNSLKRASLKVQLVMEVCQTQRHCTAQHVRFTVHDTKFKQISHVETCEGYIAFYVSYHNFLLFGIPQIIVFIWALQFITFSVHAPSKQSCRCWGLLWTNRSEKTVVLSSLQDFQQIHL